MLPFVTHTDAQKQDQNDDEQATESQEIASLKVELQACDIDDNLINYALGIAKENGISDLTTLTARFPDLDAQISGGSDQGKSNLATLQHTVQTMHHTDHTAVLLS